MARIDEARKKLKELAGEHRLQAVAYGKDGNGLFKLDGITYEAVCDEDDGYRSYMDDLTIVKDIPQMFDIPVLVSFEDAWHDDRIEILDRRNKLLVLNVGTKDLDDYYPCYVFDYHPENIFENKDANHA